MDFQSIGKLSLPIGLATRMIGAQDNTKRKYFPGKASSV